MEKAILITGALGGLGKALVEASEKLSNVDYIIATDVKKEILQVYEKSSRIIGLEMDVSSEESILNIRQTIRELRIEIKYIINNAGIARFFPVSETDQSSLDQILKINAYGPVMTVSAFINDLIKHKGRVIQISSDNVRLSGAFQPYASSKIAMESLSVAMRQELDLHGVKLVLIRPGAIRTNLLNEVDQAELSNKNSIYKAQFTKFRTLAGKEVGRITKPEKVAQLVIKAIE